MKKTFEALATLFFLIIVWSGCSSGMAKSHFQQAYSLLNTNPDSALSLLEEIDWPSLQEKDQAIYCLLYTIAQDKSGLDVDNDSLLGIAYNYFRNREQDSLYAKCLYYMGKYYLLNDSTRMAENCFTHAIRISKEKEDYYTTYLALEKLSKSLNRSNPKVAIPYAKEAYRIYEDKFNDNISNKVFLLLEIGDSFDLADENDSARYYYNLALNCAKESHNNVILSSVFQDLSASMQKQRNDSALIFSKKAWEMAPIKDASLASNLAYAYLLADSVAQSEELLLALCKSKSLSIRQRAFQLLTECAFRKGNLNQAWEYTDSTLSLGRRRYETALKDKVAYFQSNNDKILQLKIIEKDKQNQRYIFIGLVMTCVFLLLFFISLHRNRLLNVRNRMLKIEQEKELEAIRYLSEKEKQDLRLQQEEEQIKLLKAYIHTAVDLKGKIKQTMEKNKRDVLIDENLWKEIEQFLNASESKFVTRLIDSYPSLSKDDFRFCMLLRLGFSIKELSRIYCISEDSIKQKQSKFKYKLNMENASISLRKYLQSF